MISHILAEFHPERATNTIFAQSLILNGLSKSAQTFTVGFVKLLSTHPIHIVVWGNFSFNRNAYNYSQQRTIQMTTSIVLGRELNHIFIAGYKFCSGFITVRKSMGLQT